MLKVYESKKVMEVDLKKFESESNDLLVKILKFFDKNALGRKDGEEKNDEVDDDWIVLKTKKEDSQKAKNEALD